MENNKINTLVVLKSNNLEDQKKLSLFKLLDWREGVIVKSSDEGFVAVPYCPSALGDLLTEKVGGYKTNEGWETERCFGKEHPLPSIVSVIREWLDNK